MECEFILGPDGVLYHSGIKGMKWGIRRYQNKDGSLTPAGRKRYNKEMEKLKAREKEIKAQEKVKARQAKLDAKKADLDEREKALKGEKAKTNDSKPKSISEMSDEELRTMVNRLQNERLALDLERQISAMKPKQVTAGEKLSKMFNDVAVPALTQSGRKLLTDWLEKEGAKALGLKNTDELGVLKKEVEKLNLQKQKNDLTKALSGKKSEEDKLKAEREERAAEAKDLINKNIIDKTKKEIADREAAAKKAEQEAANAAKKAEQEAESNARQAAQKRQEEYYAEQNRKAEENRQKSVERDIDQRMKDIDEKNAREKAEREKPLEGTVVGEGTSRRSNNDTSSSKRSDPIIIDMDDYTSSSNVTSLVPSGRSYVQYLLEDGDRR